MKRLFVAAVLFSLVFGGAFAQDNAGLYASGEYRTAEEALAAQEFRRGVQAYYRGAFNESLMQFEKAIGYLPSDNLILDWMGKAYYFSGMGGTALQQWTRAAENGYGGLLLQNKIEIVSERRVFVPGDAKQEKYTEAGSFSGFYNGTLLFSQPVSALANPDGTFWVLSYGTNELLLFNVNGFVIDRIPGPINGFDRPLDIIRLASGDLLVSEFAGDRLALLDSRGKFKKYFGSKGRGAGQMVGPQYIAQDVRENVFVSDYGNRRVDVFDKDGEPLFSFGEANGSFEGLKGPTGIAVIGNAVYIADDIDGCIYEFDISGNFRRNVVEKGAFSKPEALKVWNDYIVVCDTNKIFSIDVRSGAIFENMTSGNAPSRLTSAVPDVNENVIVTDMKSNEVYVMAKMQEVVGGLFVQIEKVYSENFPEVTLEIKVENRYSGPLVGLRENNFYITEEKRPVSNLRFNGAGADLDFADITILIDRSASSRNFNVSGGVENCVREIARAMNGKGVLKIVSAGSIPALEYSGVPEGAVNFSESALKTPISDVVPFDLALRLCANGLINAEKKRAIIVIGSGKITQDAFSNYLLSETAAYLKNNSIPCYYVEGFAMGKIDEEIEYIVKNTCGKDYHIWREEGLSEIINDIVSLPNGYYSFTYTSALGANFGEKYLPVEAETYLLNRSGRDETGYFAPLQ